MKLTRTLNLVLLVVFYSNVIFAQSNIRLNNYWENTHFINPASANRKYVNEISIAGRQQLDGVYGMPSTFFFSCTYYNQKINDQLGLMIFQDKIGYTQTHDINLSYLHTVQLTDGWQMHLGAAACYEDISFDISKVRLSNNVDQAAYSSLDNRQKWNVNTGVELVSEKWKLGCSGLHVMSAFDHERNIFTNTNFLYGMYRNEMSPFFDLGSGAVAIQYGHFFQFETNLMLYYKDGDRNDILNVGLTYRSRSDVGAILGFQVFRNVHFSYCFDYDVLGISQNTYGTHELMFTYQFNKRKNCNCQ